MTAREELARQIIVCMTIPLEASGRHVHLKRAHVEALFGPGYRLTPVRDLSQPGQFVCRERVRLEGPGGQIDGVVVLGPEREESQVEISLTDAVALGVEAPIRLSGDTKGSPGVTLRVEGRTLALEEGVIVAKRHIHLSPSQARRFRVSDGEKVQLRTFTRRSVVFDDTEVRVSEKFAPAVHLDYDEANACGYQKGDRGMIVAREGAK